MLIVGFKQIGKTYLANKYKENVIELTYDNKSEDENQNIIKYLEDIKSNLSKYEIVLITYNSNVIKCLDALNIEYAMAYKYIDMNLLSKEDKEIYAIFVSKNCPKIIIQPDSYLENILENSYDFITVSEQKEVIQEETQLEPASKQPLTLKDLVTQDIEITENDIRGLKSIQNKLKAGMLIQAKANLNRILKLTTILDKLYDELLTRIDTDLQNADTASLMYTTDYISKALHENNQFIMTLMNNEKIQNFFVVDNSNIVNINNSSITDKDKREKIRKVVEIVLDNLDMFEQGQFAELKNPNIIDVSEDNNADS